MTTVNYSHPLTERAKFYLADLSAATDLIEHQAQIEWDEPLTQQLEALVEIGKDAHFIIPPSLPVVAAYVTAALTKRAGRPVGVIVMRPYKDGIRTIFLPSEIVYP